MVKQDHKNSNNFSFMFFMFYTVYVSDPTRLITEEYIRSDSEATTASGNHDHTQTRRKSYQYDTKSKCIDLFQMFLTST